MQIVIDISKEDFATLIALSEASGDETCCADVTRRLGKAAKNATILPDEHDKLIDADRFIGEHIRGGSACWLVSKAPVVIGATWKK